MLNGSCWRTIESVVLVRQEGRKSSALSKMRAQVLQAVCFQYAAILQNPKKQGRDLLSCEVAGSFSKIQLK